MPSVLDTPTHIASVETPNLSAARSQARHAPLECLQTLMHRVARPMIHPPRAKQAPSGEVHRPFETSMDRLAREYPSLSVYALALM